MATWLRVPAAIPFPRAETNSLAAVLPKTQAGRFVDLYDVYGDHYAGELASGDEWESDEPLGMSAHADTPADPEADTGEERVHSAKGVQQSLAALARSEHGGGDMMTGVFEMHDKRQRVNKLKQRAKRVQGAQMLSHISMLPRMQPRMNILKADKKKEGKGGGGYSADASIHNTGFYLAANKINRQSNVILYGTGSKVSHSGGGVGNSGAVKGGNGGGN